MDLEKWLTFQPKSLEKTQRLLGILEEMVIHHSLKGQFAMYGGTAINLFMLDVPRLSVDIDVTYIGSSDKEEMIAAKPKIEAAIKEIAQSYGYFLSPGKAEHAGRSFFLSYKDESGSDHIKIDFTYLNRVPLLPIEQRSTPLCKGLSVPMLSDYELVAGKVKAFLSRVKVRDLYDISNLATFLNTNTSSEEREKFHKVILFYVALSAAFPFDITDRALRFENQEEELRKELYTMLRTDKPAPSLDSLISSASSFINNWVLPQNETEREFLECFAEGELKPDLIFCDEKMIQSAKLSPEAAWKLKNLLNVPTSANNPNGDRAQVIKAWELENPDYLSADHNHNHKK